MKNKIYFIILISFLIFCFVIFYKGMNNSNTYTPNLSDKKNIPVFTAKDFFLKNEFKSEKIFADDNFYIVNIWASWCLPCRNEHPILMKLSKNKSLRLIGLNYRDNLNNAKKFIDELGNPYSQILIDKNGTLAVEFGAYGIPETFIIDKDKKIIKKFVGPLTEKLLKEIEMDLK
jgi:cytochrome c biogenesis protein CcmG, thiol:disulfide interchange protein DsbE